MKYELVGGSPASFNVRIDGKILKISADGSTAHRHLGGAVQVKAKDPRGLEATATYQLSVTASNRPKPVANDDLEPNAAAGKPVTVKVLANDANPFPETPLKIIAATAETGSGNAEVSGDAVTVTPAPGFSGTMVVSYTVADKTEEASRHATARIRLTVKDKPLAPTTPQAQSVGDQTALLTWSAPADRGSPITKYTVYGEAGFRQDCPANTCTLTGLVNNTKYHFQVTATNEFGESDRSPASAEVRPDVKPDTPAGAGAQVRRQAARRELGGAGQQGLAGQVLRPGDFAGPGRPERPDPEPDRCQLRLEGTPERRVLQGAGPGPERRQGTVRVERVLRGRSAGRRAGNPGCPVSAGGASWVTRAS